MEKAVFWRSVYENGKALGGIPVVVDALGDDMLT